MLIVVAGNAGGQRKVKCKRSGKRGQKWNDMQEVIIESEVNRWMSQLPPNPQMNEGPYSWTPGLWAEIYTLFFWPSIVQIVLCTGLSTHAVFSDKAKPGGQRRACCVWRLDYAEWQTLRDALADWSLLRQCGLRICHPAAEHHQQNCCLVDWHHSKHFSGLTELEMIRREMGGESTEEKHRIVYTHSTLGKRDCRTMENQKHDILSLLVISTCTMSSPFSAVSNVKYCLVSTSLALPFIRLFLWLFSCPLPDHCCVCGQVFRSTKQRAACIAYLALCTSACDLSESHRTLIANNDELAKRSRGKDEVVIAAALCESIMENICHVPLCILVCACNPYAN